MLGLLAVIAAIAVPSINGLRLESALAKARTDLAVLQSAAEAYHFKYKAYPPEINYQETLMNRTDLLPQKLTDPLTGAEYVYKLYGRYYVFLSPGANRKIDFTETDLNLPAGTFTKSANDDLLVTNLKVRE